MEFTITARHNLGLAFLHGQPALTAEPLAAPLLPLAQVLALLEALSALRARQAQRAVLQAVIGGVFEVDQLLARDGAEGLGDGPPAGRAVPRTPQEIHLQSPVVLLLQVVPHFPEFWQLQPAGLSGAAS